MRLFILGATGNTGSALVQLALQRGHSVTAFVRSPQKLAQGCAGLHAVQGSPGDLGALEQAMAGHDAVFNCVAPGMSEIVTRSSNRSWSMRGYAQNIVSAMQRVGVQRLLAFSSAGLFPNQSLFVRMLSFPARHHMADLAAMDAFIQGSDTDWTLARPTWMSQGQSEDYRAERNALPTHCRAMHFKGLARFLLDAAVNGGYRREMVGLGR